MGNKLYEVNFFGLCSKKNELRKQNHLLKIGFGVFLKGDKLSDFIDYRLLDYIPSGIQIHFPLFWSIFFQTSSRSAPLNIKDIKTNQSSSKR